MSRKKRRKFTAEFKTKAALEALEALKERTTIALIAQKYDLQPMQNSKWKRELKDNISQVFENPRKKEQIKRVSEESKIYEKIGRLEMELDWLKKKWTLSTKEKRFLIGGTPHDINVGST
jgi:transposase-like protein